MKNTRRNFLQKIGQTSAILAASSTFSNAESVEERIIQIQKRYSSNDKVRLGVIGMGIIGHIDFLLAKSSVYT